MKRLKIVSGCLVCMLSFGLPADSAVELYKVSCTLTAPAFITFTLNSPATVTICFDQIADINGPIDPPVTVKTDIVNYATKGDKLYAWPVVKDDGSTADPGTYRVRLTASTSQAQWDPITGLYLNCDYYNEYPPRPLPSVPEVEGPYGIGVSKNSSAPNYGYIYAGRKPEPYKAIFVYDPAGKNVGRLDDSSIAWGSSSPWDIDVADDGYVYVSDRTNQYVYCFDPNGNLVSQSPQITYFRALHVEQDDSGVTHVYGSGETLGVYKSALAADHTTWSGRTLIYNPPGDANTEFGMWVSPDLSTIYQACVLGNPYGLTKWNRQVDGTYSRDTGWTSSVGPCVDVEMSTDGQFLWVTKMVSYQTDNPATTQIEPTVTAIRKVDVATGSEIPVTYDVVTWALMCSRDAVNNVAVTFGKSVTSWAQRYWGLFAEPGSNTTSTKTTNDCTVTEDPAPAVVPGSETWSDFSDPNYPGKLFPNGTATAKVTFKAMDVQGHADIGTIKLDLTELGGGSAVDPDTRVPDGGDPNGKTLICTKTVTAVAGTRCDRPCSIPVTVCDVHPVTPQCSGDTFHVSVVGNRITSRVKHIRWADYVGGSYVGGLVQDAYIKAYGGKVGVSGYPFTYTSPKTDANGVATVDAGEGVYEVYAEKLGFKTQPSVTGVNVPQPSSPQGPAVNVGDLLLGPISIAECRAILPGTTVSVEGVCFAQPKGEAPTAAYGLDYRLAFMPVAPVPPDYRRQWYMCDPNDPANGMLFMLRKTDVAGGFPYTYDDPNAQDPDFGTPWYIGPRPAVGDTVCVTGLYTIIAWYERRVQVKEDFAVVPTFKYNYLNRGNLGGLPSTPVSLAISDIYHTSNLTVVEKWGKFARVENASVVKWSADGRLFELPGTQPAGWLPYALISDSAGNWATVTFDTCASLNIPYTSPNPPAGIDVGDTYTFTGATGRRARIAEGTLRVRGASDYVKTYDVTVPGADSVDEVKGLNEGEAVNVRGIVTLTGGSFYIQSTSRAGGIRIDSSAPYVQIGDDLQVIGTISVVDGEKTITPTYPAVVHSSGNPIPPAFNMRTRDVGGSDYGPNDPGVTGGRGALNVGLLVHLSGMVTARDPDGRWFYLWDGANSTEAPVDDGTGNRGVRIARSYSCTPWTDWVEVTGVVTTNTTAVPGRVIPELLPTSSPVTVTAFDSISSPAGAALKAPWSLVGLPAAPAFTGAGGEADSKPWDPWMVLSPSRDPWELDFRLYRLESANQSMYTFDPWLEPGGPFGGLLLGDGYWVTLDSDRPVSYSARTSSLDEWTSVCLDGWILLGHPKGHNTYWADCKVHDGGQVKTLYAASRSESKWLDSVGYWFDNQTQSMVDVGLAEDYPTTDKLSSWHGYWFHMLAGGKALIVPDQPAAP